MNELAAFSGIAAAVAIGAASPGPSFVMVARTAVATSRADGLSAALGMGLGALIFACLALIGLQGLLATVPSLYLVLKAAGGVYLVFLGLRIWRGAGRSLGSATQETGLRAHAPGRSFVLGFVTQVSNPKTAIVYASVFAAFLPAVTSLAFNVGVAAVVFVIEAGWYALVALGLSSERPRRTYLRYKGAVDRTAGGVMVALGCKLVSSARP